MNEAMIKAFCSLEPNSRHSPESYRTNRLLQTGAEIYLEPKQLVNLVDEWMEKV